MNEQSTIYPNLSWAQFEMYNDNKTDAFEELCKDLFICEYLNDGKIPHADHNNPGVEVVPILEPPRYDGHPQRYISYQAKYFENSISDAQITHSMEEAVKHYAGKLDLIYLFCNKTISTGTARYQKYMKILSAYNIELELVTNTDIFALIRKYPRVADYYFQDRARATVNANNMPGSVRIASSVSESAPVSTDESSHEIERELLKEKLSSCRNSICNLEFGKLKSDLGLLARIGATNGHIMFYRVLLAAHNKEDFAANISDLPEEMKEDAYWLKTFLHNMREVTIDEFVGLSIETQIVTLDRLFTAQHWNWIINLYAGRDKIKHEVLKAFDFHVALSQFNLGECDNAHEILSALYSQYHEQRFYLYDICAQLLKANREYVFGSDASENAVKKLLSQLDAVKQLVTDQIRANEPMIAVLEMQACYHLGVTEKAYLDQAFSRYEKYPEEAKANDGVRLFSGLCFEMAGNYERASILFSESSWRTEETLAVRYLASLIDNNRFRETVSAFEDLDAGIKTPATEAIYLLAMYRLKDTEYKDKLLKVIEKAGQSLSDLFQIGFYVEDKAIFDEAIFPKLKMLISGGLQEIDLQTKTGLLAELVRNNKINLLESVLNSMPDVSVINRFIIHDVYKCLFMVANKEFEAWRHDQEVKVDLRTAERIADRFIEAGIQKRDFIQIKLLCASASHMVFSMLKYSKELFEYTNDIQTARNIVALLYERNETRAEQYEPYLNVLVESDEPGISMVVASAMLKLGRFDDADYYAYKAIYELDGSDDFDVYKSLLGFNNLTLLRHNERPVKKTISSNMIVTLESNGERWIVALDSEDGFGEKDNHSLGVEHIGRTDPIYVKLIGKGKRQVLNIRGKKYKVVSFEPREFFIGRFIYQKAVDHQNEFSGAVKIVSTENTDEMIKQVLALSDHREQTKALIDAYNFGTNSLGIPVDFFIHGDYERYIEAQRYLLYAKDLAYYAGEPSLDSFIDAKYVPAISTLILLASKGWLDTLNWLGDRVVIPESYLSFFREQYAQIVETQAVSPGSLVPLDDGKFTIVEPDKKIPDIFEAVINKCETFSSEAITDDERIAYEVFDGITYERLFAGMKMDKVQLDALILTEKLNCVYYCDDLFFRKIAAYKGIKNVNFATLLYAQDNLDVVMPIIMELSKTNYVFTPIRCRNNEEGQELIDNLLEGEKKKYYYSQSFSAYIYVRDQIMKQYFDVEQSDESKQ